LGFGPRGFGEPGHGHFVLDAIKPACISLSLRLSLSHGRNLRGWRDTKTVQFGTPDSTAGVLLPWQLARTPPQFSGYEHSQECGGTVNVACYGQEFGRHKRVLIRKPFKTRADTMKMLDFVEDRLEIH
jgi:hypothetical protein